MSFNPITLALGIALVSLFSPECAVLVLIVGMIIGIGGGFH